MKPFKLFNFLCVCALLFFVGGMPLTVHATADTGLETTEGEGAEGAEGEDVPEETPTFEPEFVINLPVAPNIYLTVFTEEEWYNSQYAIAHVIVTDVANSGWELSSIQAKIGREGNWFDITEDQSVVLSENGSLYISVTDAEGNVYEKSVNITCFDYEQPYLNAAVSDGVLLVQPYDALSGVRAIYINGYEFLEEDFVRGNLSVRLQQFDASFPYFMVQAIDRAGNTSSVYRFDNPYYLAPDADENAENPAAQLPISAMPSAPSDATGLVTDHVETDVDGNEIEPVYTSDTGRVYYTIETETGKVFYLIVDRDGNQEEVYFLTEIDENDLLNTISDTSQTLPQNSTAVANNNGMLPTVEVQAPVTEDDISEEQAEATGMDKTEEVSENSVSEDAVSDNAAGKTKSDSMGNIFIAGAAVIVIIVGYFVKVKKPKKKKQTDEAIDEEDDEILMDEEDDY